LIYIPKWYKIALTDGYKLNRCGAKGDKNMNELRVFRASRKLSGNDMAKILGITAAAYYQKEHGNSKITDIDIRKIREAFNLSIEEVCKIFGL
jgi:transcriptional regulator with XRE-family HTH domain